MGAFVYCRSLTSITIQDGVTSIEQKAFFGCTNLASVTIPNSVSSIDCTAFSGCSGLTNITVDSNNPVYCSESGVLFNKDKTTLIYYPLGKNDSSYTIPDGVTAIDEFAFSNCSKLTSITIPSSVNYIGNYAFYNCSGLTIIYIPGGITIRTDAIPSTAAKITYTVDSSNNVTITKIELPSGQNKVDIPPEIDGKTVVAVEEGYQPYVGNHTCVSSTAATCINKATCGICGQDYYGDHNLSHHDAAAHTCTAYGTVPIFYGSVCCAGMSCCIVMGKVVVTIIILSANTASCLIYTSRCGAAYTSMITDVGLKVLINGYYRFAVDFWRNINLILS